MNDRLRKLSVLKMLESASRIAIQCIQTYLDLRKLFSSSSGDNQNWVYDFPYSDWFTQNQTIALAAKRLSSSRMESESRRLPWLRFSCAGLVRVFEARIVILINIYLRFSLHEVSFFRTAEASREHSL